MPVKKKAQIKKKAARPLKAKPASKKALPKTKKTPRLKAKPGPLLIGKVTHYFPQAQACAIKLKSALKMGDTIRIKGHTTDFSQAISSMQIDRAPIKEAKKGQEIGLQTSSRVRRKDQVYKIEPKIKCTGKK